MAVKVDGHDLRRVWLSLKEGLAERGLLLTLVAAVLGYFSAAFLQVGIEDLLDDEKEIVPRATLVLWILNFVAVIFIAMLANILIAIRSDLKGVKRFKVTWSDRPHEDERAPVRRDGAYEYCSQKAWEARRRIDIFGPVFMHRHQHNDDDETVHDRYLEDGIEKAVYRRRTQTEGEDFSYKRVIQSPHDISKAMRPGGTILKAAMGNKALAAHVEEVLRRRRPRGVEVNVVVREPVPGFPSTMIIDDRWVFFSLPTQRASMTGATAADERFDYDFVLGIEDVDGVLPRQLRTIITEFARIGTPIHGVS